MTILAHNMRSLTELAWYSLHNEENTVLRVLSKSNMTGHWMLALTVAGS